MDPGVREAALTAWKARELMRAGNLLYESFTRSERVAWAAAVLRAVLAAVDAPAPVKAVLEIARDESRWGEGHTAFSSVRDLTLKEERAAVKDPLLDALLYLAENCAKVVYNASRRPAPFDHDAGWWIPTCARAVLAQRPDLERAVEDALFG